MTAQLDRIPEWFEYHASLMRTYETSVLPFKVPLRPPPLPPQYLQHLLTFLGKYTELYKVETSGDSSIDYSLESSSSDNDQETCPRTRSREFHHHQTLRKSPFIRSIPCL